jgi:hypothetical protein
MADLSPLIVPIVVDAMVVNDFTRAHVDFQRWKLRYDHLTFFDSPEPDAFSGLDEGFSQTAASNGVYLHWTLPSALRHATAGVDAPTANFPLVPNRWWILRTCNRQGRRTYAAWVVESDYENPTDGTTSFMKPAATAQATKIGRRVPVGSAPYSDTNRNPLYLTAVGPGEPLLAAYQPYCDNVFSIHDPLDETVVDGDQLSYMVMGWYSAATGDILAPSATTWGQGPTFQDYLDELEWSVTEDFTATTSVYQGLVYGLPWSEAGSVFGAQPNWPLGDKVVNIGIGHTAVDALTAFAKSMIASSGLNMDPLLLEAFQYGLLHELSAEGGLEALSQKIHLAWFQQYQGGFRWAMDPPPANSPEQMGQGRRPDPENVRNVLDAVATLNLQQAAYDDALRTLAAQQVALYEMYWKQGYAGQMNYPQTPATYYQTQLRVGGGGILDQVIASLQLVNTLAAGLPQGNSPEELAASATASLRQQGLTVPDGYILRQYTLPVFAQANDPVLLISGLNSAALQETDEDLVCRFSDQLVTKVTFDPSHSLTITNASTTTGINLQNLPAVTNALACEFMMLDPAQNPVPQAGAPTYTGTLPAIYPTTWSPPWNPLYIEWEVEYYPIDYTTNGQENWLFNGRDFEWRGENRGNTGKMVPINGRIFLSPQSTYNFKSRLLQYLEANPDMPLRNIEELIDRVNGWDFLSQSMDGFSPEMLLRDSLISSIPDTPTLQGNTGLTLAQLMGKGPKSPLLPGLPNGTAAESNFQLLRSGQMVLSKLYVIDSMGQCLQIVNALNAQHVRPAIAESMVPAHPLGAINTYRFIDLQPRLLQPAKLNFELLNPDGNLHWQYPTQNPVVGWVISNHLDRSIAVYDPAGMALGELRVMYDAGNTAAVRWESAPSVTNYTFANLQVDYPELWKVLNPMLGQTTASFQAFLRLIDESLWGIHPTTDAAIVGLSVLAGRPLALVKAGLQFQMSGNPMLDPSWYNTQTQAPNGVRDIPFRIRLGDLQNAQDGLVGYYVGDNYGQLNVVHMPVDIDLSSTTPDGYLVPIGGPEGNYLRQSLGGRPVQVTLLLDPRAAVNAYAGIVPVSKMQVPYAYVAPVMSQMQLYFRVGPLLSTVQQLQGTDQPASIVMPLPKETTSPWAWLNGFRYDPDQVLSIADSDQSARFDNTRLVLRNGMLLLSGAFANLKQEDPNA